MSDTGRLKLPKIVDNVKKRDGSDVTLSQTAHGGDVRGFLTSRMSKPVRCILSDTGSGRLTTQHAGNIVLQRAGRSKEVSVHFPPLPVEAVAKQQVRQLASCCPSSSLRLDSQHPQQERHSFKKLSTFPARLVKEDCSTNEGSQLKRVRLPACLPPFQNRTQTSSCSAEPGTVWPTTELSHFCKVPEMKYSPVKLSRPKTQNLLKISTVLPPVSERAEKPGKNFELTQNPRMGKAKKKKTLL